MARRGENIHKRKDGRWEARIQIVSHNGKSTYHSVYGKTYSEVKEKKKKYLENNNQTQASRNKKITFETILDCGWNTDFFIKRNLHDLSIEIL